MITSSVKPAIFFLLMTLVCLFEVSVSQAHPEGFSPHFPFPFGKTRLDSTLKAGFTPLQKNLRYLEYQNYYSVYDIETKTPLLTIHHIGTDVWNKKIEKKIAEMKNGPVQAGACQEDVDHSPEGSFQQSTHHSTKRPKSKFLSDQRLRVLERVGHNDYRDVTETFSRGHLTPSGDFSVVSYQKNTFMTSNIAPQVQYSFNDNLWERLESCVRQWGSNSGLGFTVITGVIHDDHHKVNLNSKIRIPTHFYKILIDETTFPPKTSAFLMENRVYDVSDQAEMDIASYLVPISKLEELSGIRFLITIPDQELRKKIVDSKSILFEGCDARMRTSHPKQNGFHH